MLSRNLIKFYAGGTNSMKTANELFERLKTDEAFAKDFTEALKARREAGAKSYYETVIPSAEKFGYSISKEELDEYIALQDTELSEEELGKVAGGTSCGIIGVTVLVTLATGGTIAATIQKALSDD